MLDAAAQEEYNCAVETRILARIPDNWGKYVSCQTGWYPLLDVLDSRLAGINPDYCIFQVKQKFGRLVCYFDIPTPDPENLTDEEYSAQVKKEEEQLQLMQGIVEEIVLAADTTCEECGQPGELTRLAGWWETLCETCFTTKFLQK